MFYQPPFGQIAPGEAQGTGGEVGHGGFDEHEKAAVLDDDAVISLASVRERA